MKINNSLRGMKIARYLLLLLLLGSGILLLSQTVSATADSPPPFNNSELRSPDILRNEGFTNTITWKHRASGNLACANTTTVSPTWNNVFKIVDGVWTTGPVEATGMRVTFDTSVCTPFQQIVNVSFNPSRNLSQIVAGADYSGNLAPVELWALDSSGGILGKVSLPEANPTIGKLVFLNATMTNVAYINIVHQTGNVFTGQDLFLWALHAWDSSNKTYPIALAYADYLAKTGVVTSLGTGTQASTWSFETESFQVPPGKGFYYASIVYQHPCLATNQCWTFLEPVSQSTDLTFDLQTVSYGHFRTENGREGPRTAFSVWTYNNVANQARSASLINTSMPAVGPSCNDTAGNPCLYYSGWYDQVGSLFASCNPGTYANNDCKPSKGITTMPFGNASCLSTTSGKNCAVPNSFKPMYGFGYKDKTGPFATIAFSALGWGDTSGDLLDGKNITTIPLGTGPIQTGINNDGTFTLDLGNTTNRYTFAGNAIYLVLARVTDVDWCNVGNGTIQVNGVDTEVAIDTFFFDPSLPDASDTTTYCGWIIDDFMQSNNLNQSSIGENVYFSNERFGLQYEIVLPPNLRFSDYRVVQQIKGIHADRIACRSDLAICFGNADTQGFDVPGATQPVLWKWNVTDQQTSLPIEGAKVFEVLSSTSGLTSINGFVNVTTQGTKVQWSLTKQGYNAHHMNVSFLNVDTIFVNATMTKLAARPFNDIDCSIGGNNSLLCTSNSTSDASQTCQEIYGNDGSCRKGPVFGVALKEFQFGCPADTSTAVARVLSNVSVYESVTSRSLVIGSPGGSGVVFTEDCFGGSTIDIQSNEVAFTFSKNGYRQLTFNASWLDKPLIKITPLFKTGDGSATDVTISVTNTTLIVGGSIAKPATIIVVKDNGAPETSAVSSASGSPGLEVAIVGVLDGIGFSSETGKSLGGLFLFIVILYLVYEGFNRNSKPVAIVSIPAFFVIGFLGLWPSWLMITAVLGIVAFLVISYRSREAA